MSTTDRLNVGDRCWHRNDAAGIVFVITREPDERGWLAYSIEGDGPTQYSGNERDMGRLGGDSARPTTPQRGQEE